MALEEEVEVEAAMEVEVLVAVLMVAMAALLAVSPNRRACRPVNCPRMMIWPHR